MTQFAREYEDEFVKIVVSEQYKQIQLAQERNKRELGRTKSRQTELEIIFDNLFEKMSSGLLTESDFSRMTEKYTAERMGLESRRKELEKVVASEQGHVMDVNRFLEMVRRYTAVNELTPEILRHFIDRIVVHHRVERKNSKTQKVDFYFNFIGKVEMPMLHELAPYKKSFGRQKENHTAKAV